MCVSESVPFGPHLFHKNRKVKLFFRLLFSRVHFIAILVYLYCIVRCIWNKQTDKGSIHNMGTIWCIYYWTFHWETERHCICFQCTVIYSQLIEPLTVWYTLLLHPMFACFLACDIVFSVCISLVCLSFGSY